MNNSNMEHIMTLGDFVTETIMQIADGVKNAQEKTKDAGCLVCPKKYTNNVQNTIKGYYGEYISLIDFTVVLQNTTDSENKAGVGVWLGGVAIGAKGENANRELTVTTVKFSVPVQLPFVED
jgi:hypothetical protein